jgi:hypothetical protein
MDPAADRTRQAVSLRKSSRRSQMKNDVEDIPMVYLLYVLLAIAVIVGIAAILIVRLIPA